MVIEGAVEAAVAFICKSRTDSFAEGANTVWDDAQRAHPDGTDTAFVEPPSGEWLDALRASGLPVSDQNSLRSPAVNTKAAKRRTSDAIAYGDENRPHDANVDRHHAMKLATSPRLRAAPVTSPTLAEVAQARFTRVPSMQQSATRHSGSRHVCRSPQNQSSPRGVQSIEDLIQAGRFSPRQSKPPLKAVAQPAPRTVSDDWPPAEACVVYQPNSTADQPSSAASSYIPQIVATPSAPTHLQTRQMSRCSSVEVQVRRSSFASPQTNSRVVAAAPVKSSFAADSDLIRKRFVQVPSPSRAPSRDRSFEIPRNPSHDADVYAEAKTLQTIGVSVPPTSSFSGDHPVLSPHASSRTTMGSTMLGVPSSLSFTGDRPVLSPHASSRTSMGGSMLGTGRPMNVTGPQIASRTAAATRSRSSTIFWKPPPEAVALCQQQKSPSFLLNSSGEVPAAPNRESTTDTEGERPPQAIVGSSSSHAVASAVCLSFIPPSPSLGHRGPKPSPATFSYVPARHHSQAASPK